MAVIGNPTVSIMHPGLDLDSTARGINNAPEPDEEAVAHYLENTPAVSRYHWFEDLAAMLPQGAERMFLIYFQRSAVAYDVGCH